MSRLSRADCSQPGITRKGRGKGFEFLGPDGEKITDPEILERCRALVLPPAWKEVWICPQPNGHLQAVGTDAAGRRQYRTKIGAHVVTPRSSTATAPEASELITQGQLVEPGPDREASD